VRARRDTAQQQQAEADAQGNIERTMDIDITQQAKI
jgi:hypothetical protein